MRWRDVDLEANILRLTDERASKHRQKVGCARLLKGKSSRSVPLHADFRRVLEQMPRHADGLAFHGPQGGRLKPDTVRIILIREVIKPLADKFPTAPGEVGFEHGRLHSFRHYFVSEAFRRGATEPWIMEWVGHKESQIVARCRHLRDDDGQREMARLDLLSTQVNPDGPESFGFQKRRVCRERRAKIPKGKRARSVALYVPSIVSVDGTYKIPLLQSLRCRDLGRGKRTMRRDRDSNPRCRFPDIPD